MGVLIVLRCWLIELVLVCGISLTADCVVTIIQRAACRAAGGSEINDKLWNGIFAFTFAYIPLINVRFHPLLSTYYDVDNCIVVTSSSINHHAT